MFLLLFFLSIAFATEEVRYQGLRVDLSAITLNRDILSCITPVMIRTLEHNFRSYHEHGTLRSLYIKDIKITEPIIDEKLFEIDKFTFKPPIYELKGEPNCIRFSLSFKYSMTFLGLTIASGTGSGIVKNDAEKILVFFNETHPDVHIPYLWDVKDIELSWGIFNPKEWIEKVLEDRFLTEFHEVVDDAMYDFADKLLEAYEKVEDIFGDDYDLLFYNSIMDVKATKNNSYISIGFATNITANDEFVRKMYRVMTEPVSPLGHFSYCLPAELLADSLDVLQRAGYNEMYLEGEFWGFDNSTILALLHILPSLKDEYSNETEFRISCTISPGETINEVTQGKSDNPELEFQYPIYCTFIVLATKEVEVLIVYVYMGFKYSMMVSEENQGYIGFADRVILKGFVEDPPLPISRRKKFNENVYSFSRMLEEGEIIAGGIKVRPNREEQLRFSKAEVKAEEICFGYDENE